MKLLQKCGLFQFVVFITFAQLFNIKLLYRNCYHKIKQVHNCSIGIIEIPTSEEIIDLMQDCGSSIADTLELLQSCAKPSEESLHWYRTHFSIFMVHHDYIAAKATVYITIPVTVVIRVQKGNSVTWQFSKPKQGSTSYMPFRRDPGVCTGYWMYRCHWVTK